MLQTVFCFEEKSYYCHLVVKGLLKTTIPKTPLRDTVETKYKYMKNNIIERRSKFVYHFYLSFAS